jgi:predicted DsbA family dithiol-disulfide isomerase
MLKLDIFSDPVCPWCYIGKTNLDRAMERNPDHPFEVEWHPFQLNPDMPREGVDRASWLEARFGGRDRVVQMHLQVQKVAQDAGAEMNFDRMTRLPNTLDAHRMIHWAGLEGKQSAMVSALFRAYWREGRDIGNAGVLADLGAEIGLDRPLMQRLLASDADRAEIEARDRHARSRGVSAVPTFLIDNHYVVSGAQPPALWQQVIDELGQKEQAE